MLVRNTIYNVAGLALPLLVAAVAIPVLISVMGDARFGFLTLMWAVSGYFGLFDLGIGRAITRHVAIIMKRGDLNTLGTVIGSGHAVMLLVGVAAGIALFLAAPLLVTFTAGLPDSEDALIGVYAMAAAVPAIVLTAGVRGIFEGLGEFRSLNLIRLPLGIFTFVGPLLSVWVFGPSLAAAAWTLAVGRVVGLIVHIVVALRILPSGAGRLAITARDIRTLATTGGWLTVSNLTGSMLGYLDRFLVGASISASAVAYYATPQEITARLWIIPSALTAVLFPTFSAEITAESNTISSTFSRSVLSLFLVIMPISGALVLFAHELMSAWISPEFANNSAEMLKIFAIGIWLNCLTQVPFTLIQGAGKARWAATAQLIELPIFVWILWLSALHGGATGAAVAWLVRMVLDAALMFVLSLRLLDPRPSSRVIFGSFAAFFTLSGLLYLCSFVDSTALKIAFVTALTTTTCIFMRFAFINWRAKIPSSA